MIYQHGHFKVSLLEIKELPLELAKDLVLSQIWNPKATSPKLSATTSQTGASRWFSGREFTCQCRFDFWVGKIPWIRKQQSTPVFLLGKSHRQRSLVGYSPRGRKESDTTERLHSLTHSCSVINLCPQFFRHSVRSNLLNLLVTSTA